MPHPATELALDPATRQTIFAAALYLSAALGGVLAYVTGARFGRVGMAIAAASAVLLIATTATRLPILVPVALVGLACTALAGRSIARQRTR